MDVPGEKALRALSCNDVSPIQEEQPQDPLNLVLPTESEATAASIQPTLTKSNSTTQQQQHYNSKKPLWWKRQAGKSSKAQRRTMRNPAMQMYKLERPQPYGSMLDWSTVFDAEGTPKSKNHQIDPQHREVWLEIGFGLGDNLLCLAARHHRKRCLIGAEVHPASIGTIFRRLEHGLQNERYWDEFSLFATNDTESETDSHLLWNNNSDLHSSCLYNHVRVYAGDGTKLISCVPDQSVDVVLVTFPDPFQNTPQHRLLQMDVLCELRRILTGRLYLATDDKPYHDWSRRQVEAFPGIRIGDTTRQFRLIATPDRMGWLPAVSKYEQKGWDEGRQTWLSCWECC